MNRRTAAQAVILLLLVLAALLVWRLGPFRGATPAPATGKSASAGGAPRRAALPARAPTPPFASILDQASRQEALALLEQRLVRANARPEEAVMVFRDPAAYQRFLARASAAGLTLLGQLDSLNAVRVRYSSTDSLLSELLDHTADYTEVSANYTLRAPQVPPPANRADTSDVPIGSALLDFLGAGGDSSSWGRGVTIAVLDAGVALDPTFQTGQVRTLDVGLGTAPGTGSEDGHGTAVAALAAGSAEGAQGIASAAGILSIRITDAAGLSDIFTLSQAILAAIDAGANVINISLGGYDTNSVLSSAIGRATTAGIAIVASAGNDQLAGLTWPAADPRVVSVGAVDGTGQQVTFSNSGPQLTLSAPGYGVPTAWLGGQRVQMDGTSASAPLVAGAIAAVLSQSPNLPATDAAAIVVQHASDAGEPGADPNYGNGILNVGWTMNRTSSAYADTAVASTLYDPATGVATVVVQNRGNQTVLGLQLQVMVGSTPVTLAVPGLAPGATASVPLDIDAAALQAAGQLNLGIQLINPAGLSDQVPQNNRAAGTITAPAAR
jgi:hypothetical protein